MSSLWKCSHINPTHNSCTINTSSQTNCNKIISLLLEISEFHTCIIGQVLYYIVIMKAFFEWSAISRIISCQNISSYLCDNTHTHTHSLPDSLTPFQGIIILYLFRFQLKQRYLACTSGAVLNCQRND